MMKLRCSRAPIFFRCPSSIVPVRNEIIEERKHNDPAHLGTAVHALLQHMVVSPDTQADVAALAEKHDVDADDLAQLFFYGKRCWPLMSEHFGDAPIAEKYFETDFGTFKLTGHPDLLTDPAFSGPHTILDWKSGRVEYDASWQLHCGGLLSGVTQGVIVWLREAWSGGMPFEVIPLLSKDECLEKLNAQMEKANRGVHVTGPHCNGMYCERMHECEAYQEWAQGTVGKLVTASGTAGVLDLREIAKLVHALKVVKPAVEAAEALINDMLDRHGMIDLGNGKHLVRTHMNIKTFNTAGVRLLLEELGVKEIERCFKVNGKMLQQEVKKVCGDKPKGTFWTDALEKLEERGDLHYTRRNSRREKRLVT